MIYRAAMSLLLVSCSLFGATAPRHTVLKRQVDPGNTHARVHAVVPLIGTGTRSDPFRPDYVPPPLARGVKPDPHGIIGFAFQLSDDHKHALVEFVAQDRSAFKQMMADTRPDVKVFEKGKVSRAVIEAEFRKWKHDFDPDQLHARVP